MIFKPTTFPATRSNQEPLLARRRNHRRVSTPRTWTCDRPLRRLNLYNRQWPLRTAGYFDAPAKFIFDEGGQPGKPSIPSFRAATILSGGTGADSVIGRGVRVLSHA